MDDGDSPFDSIDPDDYVVDPEQSANRSWWSLIGAAAFMWFAGLAALAQGSPLWWIAFAIALIISGSGIALYVRRQRR